MALSAKWILVKALIGAFFMGFLCADSSKGIDFLLVKAKQSANPYARLYAAAEQGSTEALMRLTEQAQKDSHGHWLKMADALGSLEAKYQLALISELRNQKALLRQAAEAGHIASQYEYAMLLEHQGSKIIWLQRAAEQGHNGAEVALYQWYLLQQEIELAKPWLASAAQTDPQSAVIYAKILWREQQYNQAISWFERALVQGSEVAQDYLAHIQHLSPETSDVAVSNTNRFGGVSRAGCLMRLQFFANSLESIRQATRFVTRFEQDQRLAGLPICISVPIWVTEAELPCSPNWNTVNRMTCELAALSQSLETIDATHLVLFSEQGKANVHNGVMHLDLADSYDVFVHELAHFAGFVDEYPLSAGLAKDICTQTEHANLMITQPAIEVMAVDTTAYVESTPNSVETPTLPKARTCNNHQAQAYKLSAKVTFMEYYDQTDIPRQYLDIWRLRLMRSEYLTPYYVNLAQLYEQMGNTQMADAWWQKFYRFKQISLFTPNDLPIGDSVD